jgi:type IV secretory pathway VirB3-like protein
MFDAVACIAVSLQTSTFAHKWIRSICFCSCFTYVGACDGLSKLINAVLNFVDGWIIFFWTESFLKYGLSLLFHAIIRLYVLVSDSEHSLFGSSQLTCGQVSEKKLWWGQRIFPVRRYLWSVSVKGMFRLVWSTCKVAVRMS